MPKMVNIDEILEFFKKLGGDTLPLFVKYSDFAILNNKAFKVFLRAQDREEKEQAINWKKLKEQQKIIKEGGSNKNGK